MKAGALSFYFIFIALYALLDTRLHYLAVLSFFKS